MRRREFLAAGAGFSILAPEGCIFLQDHVDKISSHNIHIREL